MSVDAIVTAPPLSDIVMLEPAVKARVSPFAKEFPPAVTLLGEVRYASKSLICDSVIDNAAWC